MVRKLQAVYEGGILRPVEPLPLGEHEPPARFEALADHSVSLETVRRALSRIPGSLDADFRAERNER
jgi:hypothetical protein